MQTSVLARHAKAERLTHFRGLSVACLSLFRTRSAATHKRSHPENKWALRDAPRNPAAHNHAAFFARTKLKHASPCVEGGVWLGGPPESRKDSTRDGRA